MPPSNPQPDAAAANRLMWDERVEAHWRSEMYRRDAEALQGGGHCLRDEIVRAVGDVAGKSLIHLQCHMGMETLSWARLGATVTGLDFSRPALDKAELLRDELGLKADFVCRDFYEAIDLVSAVRSTLNPPPSKGGVGGGTDQVDRVTDPSGVNKDKHMPLSRPLPSGERGLGKPYGFDVVFQSIGSLCWLPDLAGWAEVVAGLLNEGGRYVLEDCHPMMSVLEDKPGMSHLEPVYPYFHDDALAFDDEGDYADPDGKFKHKLGYEWIHPLGDIVTRLIESGLVIECLTESPWCPFPRYGLMEEARPGEWELPGPMRDKLPMTFRLVARKG